ncbi:MAG: hypothetical protein AAFN92_03260 [Bacteroidota bacterium]
MSSPIAQTIRALLMEGEQVILPGIGTLRLRPEPALIQHVDKRALPPAERVDFNENLVLDDGRLLRALKESGALPAATAAYQLDVFLKNMRENIDAGRSVNLEGIGRFSRQLDGQLKFTSGKENFSKESFGLPGLDIQPIVRTERQRRAAVVSDPMVAGASGSEPSPAPAAAPQSQLQQVLNDPRLQKYLWYVAALLGVILIITLLALLGKTIGKSLQEDEPVARVERQADQRAEVEPPRLRPAPKPVPAEDVSPEEPPRLDPEPERTPPVITTPAPSPPPVTSGKNVSLIATGLYGSQRNVDKNLRRIREAGYEPFSRAEGRYTRVGVRLEWDDAEERFSVLQAIRRRFSEDSFEMERNGEAVPLQ